MSSEFQSRMLYTQKTAAVINEEEPVSVSSTIYAIRFLYPGAQQHTTGRLRITCTYRDSDQFEAHAGVIERWTDKGWILLDDYTDSVIAFNSEEEFRKRMLNYAHSFILGIPLSIVDTHYNTGFALEGPPAKKPSSKRYFDAEKKSLNIPKSNKKEEKKDIYDKSSSKKDNDDDDLDWL